jgi:hypothetical protein
MLHTAFVMKKLQLHRENSTVNIQTGGNPKDVFAMVRTSLQARV